MPLGLHQDADVADARAETGRRENDLGKALLAGREITALRTQLQAASGTKVGSLPMSGPKQHPGANGSNWPDRWRRGGGDHRSDVDVGIGVERDYPFVQARDEALAAVLTFSPAADSLVQPVRHHRCRARRSSGHSVRRRQTTQSRRIAGAPAPRPAARSPSTVRPRRPARRTLATTRSQHPKRSNASGSSSPGGHSAMSSNTPSVDRSGVLSSLDDARSLTWNCTPAFSPSTTRPSTFHAANYFRCRQRRERQPPSPRRDRALTAGTSGADADPRRSDSTEPVLAALTGGHDVDGIQQITTAQLDVDTHRT
jgi:hypothetical protein